MDISSILGFHGYILPDRTTRRNSDINLVFSTLSTLPQETPRTTTTTKFGPTVRIGTTSIGLEVEKLTTEKNETLIEQNTLLIKIILVLIGFFFFMASSTMQKNYLKNTSNKK